MKESRFIKVLNLSELPPGKSKVVRVEGKQIALFRLSEDKFCAIDNRCPHEGYPLVQGTITINDGQHNGNDKAVNNAVNNECVLTCDWHNWKFNLDDGHCLRGGEDVRAYPIKIEQQEIHLDISDPSDEIACQQYLKSLQGAMVDGDDSRAARDIVRLLKHGLEPAKIIAEIALFGAIHDGDINDLHGWDHGMAVLTDCARVLNNYDGFQRAIPLVQGLSAVVEPRLRQGKREFPAAIDFDGSPRDLCAEFRRLVEDEQMDGAIALLRGAISKGIARDELKQWILLIATDHFLSYGHRFIYAVKALQLLDLIDWQHADEILSCLVTSIVWGTREDRLPYMRKFQQRLKAIEPELPSLLEKQFDNNRAPAQFNQERFRQALLDGTVDESFDAVDQALREGVPVLKIAGAIAIAAAARCLRFNIECDHDRTIEEGWLDVTHCFTHASAMREALEYFTRSDRKLSPELLRGLYQAARFVQYVRKPDKVLLDLPADKYEPISSPETSCNWADITQLGDEELLDRLFISIDKLDHLEAMKLARGYLELGHDASKLTTRLVKYALADSAAVPIALAHTIKQTVASVTEFNAMPDQPDRWLILLAVIRFLAAPKHQRWTYAGILQAIDFVAHENAKE